MTPRKDPREMERPRRRLGELLRVSLACPLCRSLDPEGHVIPLKVYAYRKKTVTMECPADGLKFPIAYDDLALALQRVGHKMQSTEVTKQGIVVAHLSASLGGIRKVSPGLVKRHQRGRDTETDSGRGRS
jgi:hypothetical protein